MSGSVQVSVEHIERAILVLRGQKVAANTRAQFREVIEALRALMTPPAPKRRPIGFVTPEE